MFDGISRIILIICFKVFVFSSFGQINNHIVQEFEIQSTEVKDKYLIQVALPENYNPQEKDYPAIYLLDANHSFGMLQDLAFWLNFSSEIPEVVIIGISYNNNWWQLRARDYTPTKEKEYTWGEFPLSGGADKFLNFIENELEPFVSNKYSVKDDNKTIVGLSFGGLLGFYALFVNPDLFDNYILISPALQWDNRYVFKKEMEFSTDKKSLNKTVFTAIGLKDNTEKIINPWNDFIVNIQLQNYLDLKLLPKTYENETHISVYPKALTDGLKYIFSLE